MKKIGFISENDPKDKYAWSGTMYSMYCALSRVFEIQWVPAPVTKSIDLAARIQRKLSALQKKKYSELHSGLIARLYGRNLSIFLARRKNLDALFAPSVSKLIAYLRTTIPLVYLSDATFRRIYGYYPNFSNLPGWNIRGGETLERRSLTRSRQIIMSSDWSAKSAIDDYGIDPAKVSVIEFGANIQVPTTGFERKTRATPLKLLFLGVDWQRKGGAIAIETFRYLRDQHAIPVTLKIAGCTPDIQPEPGVEVIGFLNKNNPDEYARLRSLLLESDMLLLPTRQECSAIAFSEAAAFGLPTITYDTGGVGNYVINGVNGQLFPMSEGSREMASLIARLVKEDALAALSRSSRKLYEEKLNWDVWLEKTRKVIDRAIAGKQPAGTSSKSGIVFSVANNNIFSNPL
jgi:glycosyltransferase involved in cell wall biosynthesis